jgi:PAS domain S-box-containing protein
MARKKSLLQRFHFYRKFVDHLPVGMAVLHVPDFLDTDTWKLVAVNWLAAHLIGSSTAAFLNGPLAANLPPSKIMADMVRDTLSRGKPKSLGHLQEENFSARTSYWVRLFPLDDACVGFCIEDHSLVRQARLARTESEQRCRLLSEFTRAILWRADPGTLEFTYVSPEGQQILGYWPERWLTETNFWKNHLHPEDRDRVVRLCYAASAPGNHTQDCECRMISASGNEIWFRLLIRPVFGQHGVTELTGVMAEISKLKEAQRCTHDLSRRLIHVQDREQQRLSRELHGSVAQNLVALRISLNVLEFKEPILDERARQAVADAVNLADLAIHHLRAVSDSLHPRALDEAGLFRALELFVEGFAKGSGIKVRLELPPNAVHMPAEMELALFRVVQECLANVHRHARSESVDIRIQSLHRAVLLEVADYGRGIPPELQEELLHGNAKNGVGISRMRERVAEMNGRWEIDSNGNGTTIRVLVPLPEADASFTHQISSSPKSVIPFFRNVSRAKA